MGEQFSHSHNLSINSIGSIIEPTTPPQKVSQHKRSHSNLWEQHKPGDLSFPSFNLDHQLSPLQVNTTLNRDHHTQHTIPSQISPHFQPTHPSLISSSSTNAVANSISIVIPPTSVSIQPSVHQQQRPAISQINVSEKENIPLNSCNPIPLKIDKEYLASIAKSPLSDISDNIVRLSKDQYGCRFLQKKIDENSVPSLQLRKENFEIIFKQIYQHFYELIIDPFGNYLIQKLISYCDDTKLNLILEILQFNLFQISINQHGTRALQKIIDCLKNDYQLSLLTKGLEPYIIELIKDLNGNHVIQKILNKFQPIQCQFIYNSILNDLIVVATHKHGCCVLQKCLNHVTNQQLIEFSSKILCFGNFYKLINDQFGNYVLQYLISINSININYKIYENFLKFGIGSLCNLKFSSNVIEKFLKSCYQNELNQNIDYSRDYKLAQLFDNLSLKLNNSSPNSPTTSGFFNVNSPMEMSFADLKYEIVYQILISDLNKLINDPYGNYVIQTLLDVLCSNVSSDKILLLLPKDAILSNEPIHVQVIKKWFLNCKIVSSFGKRIQSKINQILNGNVQQLNINKAPRKQLNMNSNGEFVAQDIRFNNVNFNVNFNSNGNSHSTPNNNNYNHFNGYIGNGKNFSMSHSSPGGSTTSSRSSSFNSVRYQYVPSYYQSYTAHPVHQNQHSSSYSNLNYGTVPNFQQTNNQRLNSYSNDIMIQNSMPQSFSYPHNNTKE